MNDDSDDHKEGPSATPACVVVVLLWRLRASSNSALYTLGDASRVFLCKAKEAMITL